MRFGECSYSVVACRYVEVASLQISLGVKSLIGFE